MLLPGTYLETDSAAGAGVGLGAKPYGLDSNTVGSGTKTLRTRTRLALYVTDSYLQMISAILSGLALHLTDSYLFGAIPYGLIFISQDSLSNTQVWHETSSIHSPFF